MGDFDCCAVKEPAPYHYNEAVHFCAGQRDCVPTCGTVQKLDVPELPARSVVLLRGVAWQKQALPLNGWTSTEATWISNGAMCDQVRWGHDVELLWTEED
jgi:hypothetical protein